MKSTYVKYYPNLRNVSGYIGSEAVVSIQHKEFAGWVVVWMRLEYSDEELLGKVLGQAFEKVAELIDAEGKQHGLL